MVEYYPGSTVPIQYNSGGVYTVPIQYNSGGVYTTTVAAESISMVVAVAGIALGLTKDETELLGYKAYGVCRGKTPANMYEALITLAYEIIKSRGADG